MTKEAISLVIAVVVVWLLLFAHWHPGSVVLKGVVLITVAVIGMTAAGYLVT